MVMISATLVWSPPVRSHDPKWSLADAADYLLYFCFLAFFPPLKIEFVILALILQLSVLLFLDCLHETSLFLTEGEGNGVTSLWHTVRLVLLCSSISSSLIYFRLLPHEPSSSLRTLMRNNHDVSRIKLWGSKAPNEYPLEPEWYELGKRCTLVKQP